jgi:D-alanyl-D-alanine carboxypeptidase
MSSAATAGRLRLGLTLALILALAACSNQTAPSPSPTVSASPATASTTASPEPTPSATPTASTNNPPTCRYADVLTTYRSPDDWDRSLLDTIYRLSSSYTPPDLVPTSQAGISGGGLVRALLIPDLKAMTAAAKAAGASLRVRSAYRSYATQVATFDSWVRSVGYAAALKVPARPGHSEHQLGTAIDFASAAGATYYPDWAKSKAGAWMTTNAWKYGFVMSYPKGKLSSSCYNYEPWHYRYWGVAIAKLIHDSGLVPRIWLWRNTDQ